MSGTAACSVLRLLCRCQSSVAAVTRIQAASAAHPALGCQLGWRACSQQLMPHWCTCAGGRLCPLDTVQEHDGRGPGRWPHTAAPRGRLGDALAAGQAVRVTSSRAPAADAGGGGSSFVPLTTTPGPAAGTQLAGQLQTTAMTIMGCRGGGPASMHGPLSTGHGRMDHSPCAA